MLTSLVVQIINISFQCCQLSWIIEETPDFGPYLLISILESDISRVIPKLLFLVDSTF